MVSARGRALAATVDPQAAAMCWDAGVGSEVTVDLGGHIDTRDPGPQRITGEVVALSDDPRGGHTAALRTGGLTVIITTRRNQYASRPQYERLGLTLEDFDVIVVKIGYLEPDLYDAQRGWTMALTPGGVDQDLIRLGHHRISRPLFPFDPDMTLPGTKVEVVSP